MKKLLTKSLLAAVLILLLPFILTLLFSRQSGRYAVSDIEYKIYYEQDGNKTKLTFDQYLLGVVAANMPAGYNIEALKAQAVIARTYALYNIHILTEDTPAKDQFSTSELGLSYINLSDMEQYWDEENYSNYFTKIENAVYATKGEILLYDDSLILPVFFETGTGYTRNSIEAWGIDIPYLISVPSKQDVTSTSYLKITEYEIADVIACLKQYYPDARIMEDSFFKDIAILERDSTNYVTKIDLGKTTISGEEFAKALGLSSNHFDIEEYEGKVRIICTGSGHGVGLSQYGANAMAEEGGSYKDILTHYYPGVRLVNMDD